MRPRFKCSKNSRGFSLIELLITVVIISFLGTAVFSTFAQGLRLWKRATAVKPEIESAFLFEKMASDLRNAYQGSTGGLHGEQNRMEFSAYGMASHASEGGDSAIQPSRRVSYRFEPQSGKLLKNELSLVEMLAPGRKDAENSYKELSGGLKECRFEYYHQDPKKKTYQWKSFWKSECMPKAIRISVKYDDEHSVGNHIKVVALPAQQCAV